MAVRCVGLGCSFGNADGVAESLGNPAVGMNIAVVIISRGIGSLIRNEGARGGAVVEFILRINNV